LVSAPTKLALAHTQVDSLYIPWLGRRKSWIVPIQVGGRNRDKGENGRERQREGTRERRGAMTGAGKVKGGGGQKGKAGCRRGEG
jgi:hypothetical protein